MIGGMKPTARLKQKHTELLGASRKISTKGREWEEDPTAKLTLRWKMS